jgi:type I restriction enzyme R subunit
MFNDHFGNVPWTDADRVHDLITEDTRRNARRNSDKQNARIELSCRRWVGAGST